MLFYNLFILLFTAAVLFFNEYNVSVKVSKVGHKFQKNRKDFLNFVTAIILIVLMGGRAFTVGKDTESYRRIFSAFGRIKLVDSVPTSISGMWGYRLFCKVVYTLVGNQYRVFLLLVAVITVLGIIDFINFASVNFGFSIILYVISNMYFYSWNASRQFLACSIALLSIKELYSDKTLIAVFLLILACSIHSSAIVYIVIFVIRKIKWNRRRIIIWFIAVVTGCITLSYAVPLLLSFFPRYQSLYLQSWYNGDFVAFGGITQGRKLYVSLFYLLVIIISCIFTIQENQEKKLINNWNMMAMILVEIAIGIVFRNNLMILRIQPFFTIFIIFGFPNMIEQTRFSSRLKSIIRFSIIVVLYIPLFIQISNNYGGILPYKFM